MSMPIRLSSFSQKKTRRSIFSSLSSIIFVSKADDLVGSTYKKDIDTKHKLPCIELNDAIHAIYKQVTSYWTKKHPGKKKDKDSDSDSDDSNDFDNSDDSKEEPVTPCTTPVTPILPVINDSSNSSDNETDSDESDISSIEYPIIDDHFPIYSNKLENGNIIFMEDGQPYGTLYSPENIKGLQSWLNGMSQEGHKKYSYILLQSQNF